ncbi:MAG: universal stress protein [Saprospiraceae bacterium]|nr:universal stress protein [Saprospiraceae bacterium]
MSNNILVPTDFSECADFALEAALKICKKESAHLHLFHASDLTTSLEELNLDQNVVDKISGEISLNAKDKLEVRERLIQEEGVACTVHYEGGDFIGGMKHLLDSIDIELIVMGSHGKSGRRDWLMGTNTQKVVRKYHKNVLVIKEAPSEDMFSKVVFVSGLYEDDKEVFKKFLNFIETYDVQEVHILAINLLGWFNQPTILMKELLEDFKNIASGFNCKTHFYSDYSVEAGIRHFVEEHDVSLIGISNQTRNPVKRIFLGSNVEMVVNNARVPVLSLDN